MKCQDYERQVLPFLKEELSNKEVKNFIEHVQVCDRCYEELEVYYSIYNGLQLMPIDTMTEFYQDMKGAQIGLKTFLNRKHAMIRRQKQFWIIKVIMRIVVIVVVLITISVRIYLWLNPAKDLRLWNLGKLIGQEELIWKKK